MKNALVVGVSGAIGGAMAKLLIDQGYFVWGLSRTSPTLEHPNLSCSQVDILDELSIIQAKALMREGIKFNRIFVATGFLHNGTIAPEKSLKELNMENMIYSMQVNTIAPALIAKHFAPMLNSLEPSVFSVLSARVGSISDNRLGGWYSYRASKAALNMVIKNLSIELRRSNKNSIIIGLHPGTVNSGLSKPFQKRVPPEKLFTSEYSAQQLSKVMDRLSLDDTGKLFAWDGALIEF